MTIVLSKRHEIIIKQADFWDNFLESVTERVSLDVLREKPLETVFGILGPVMLPFGGIQFKLLLYILEYFGFGLGNVGKWLDDYLGFGKGGYGSTEDSSILDAAKHAIGKIYTSIKEKFAKQDYELVKIAKGLGALDSLKELLNPSKFKKSSSIFVSLLYSLARKSLLGLVGLGVLGLIGATHKQLVGPKSESKKPVNLEAFYNEKNDVEATLISFLDKQHVGFSEQFKQHKKYDLYGSSEMEKFLESILAKNGVNSIDELRHIEVFYGPKLENIAKMIFPEAIHRPFGQKQIDVPKEKTKERKLSKPFAKQEKHDNQLDTALSKYFKKV